MVPLTGGPLGRAPPVTALHVRTEARRMVPYLLRHLALNLARAVDRPLAGARRASVVSNWSTNELRFTGAAPRADRRPDLGARVPAARTAAIPSRQRMVDAGADAQHDCFVPQLAPLRTRGILLLAIVALLVGFARPEVHVSKAGEGATIVLAVDISGSMAADDVTPTRLAAANAAITEFLNALPPKYRAALLVFAARASVPVPPTYSRAELIAALPKHTVVQGTALGDAIQGAVAGRKEERQPRSRQAPRNPPPRFSSSPTGEGTPAVSSRTSPPRSPRRAGFRSRLLLSEPRSGSVTQKLTVGGKTYSKETQVPVETATLQQVASTSGGAFYQAGSAQALEQVYEHLQGLPSAGKETARDHGLGHGRGPWARTLCSVPLGLLVSEARVSRLRRKPVPIVVALVVLGSVLAADSAAAGLPQSPPKTHECTGVPKCVSVPGPWVIVPAQGGITYLLTCPQKGSFAAGVDSLATSRDVRVTFAGLMGSPVGSGKTTEGTILFQAVSVDHERGAFKPLIGCIPVTSNHVQTVSFSPPRARLSWQTERRERCLPRRRNQARVRASPLQAPRSP